MRSSSLLLRPLCVLTLAATLPALAGVAGTLVPARPVAAEQSVTVDELLTGFAKMPGLYAEFRQESHFGLLAEPLVDTGTLHYADGKLARRTRSPSPSVVVMDEHGIEVGDARGHERIDLAGKPAVRQFVDAFTKIFAGDREGLEALYRIEFSAGEGRKWELSLVPKVSPMDGIIKKVVVRGEELKIAQMRVLEVGDDTPGGDETITTFAKVDVARKYSKREKSKLFSAKLR